MFHQQPQPSNKKWEQSSWKHVHLIPSFTEQWYVQHFTCCNDMSRLLRFNYMSQSTYFSRLELLQVVLQSCHNRSIISHPPELSPPKSWLPHPLIHWQVICVTPYVCLKCDQINIFILLGLNHKSRCPFFLVRTFRSGFCKSSLKGRSSLNLSRGVTCSRFCFSVK